MVDAFKDMIKRWKDFNGRSGVGEYWWAQLAVVIILTLASMVLGLFAVLLLSAESTLVNIIFGLLCVVYSVGVIFLSVADLALTIRRIRDAGFPWWFWFANFIPSVGNIAVIVLCCFPTTDTPRIDLGGSSSQPAAPKATADEAAPTVDIPKQVNEAWTCASCGAESTGNFCGSCGAPKE